jgi:Mechanosensitive ion channel
VIEVGSTYGSVTYLGARYASVRGRDGKEHLIPNENLITNQVINWSYSSPLVRLDVKFGVAYSSDLHAVRDLAAEAASRTHRVLASPRPVCHVTGFGDSAVDMLLRFGRRPDTRGDQHQGGGVSCAVGCAQWTWDRDPDAATRGAHPRAGISDDASSARSAVGTGLNRVKMERPFHGRC